MNIERFKNNTAFYEGYEGETEIELFIENFPEYNIHIWEGFFSDIFGEPSLDGKGWNGFTRDYQQEERTFEAEKVKIDVDEYLTDLYIYSERQFKYEDTRKCYELLCNFLEYAKQENLTVLVNWW